MHDVSVHLKSNRLFLVNIFIAAAIVGASCIVVMSICICVDLTSMQECYQEFIMFIVYTVIMICLSLVFKLYRGRSYDFSKEDIKVYKKKCHIDTIRVSDIDSISFYFFKLHYIITIFAGALKDGGCWKLHVKLKDGTKKELAFFSKKDAKLLKDKLYGDLLIIS